MLYNSALVSLVDHSTPDPYVVHASGKFNLLYTCGDRIEMLQADVLTGFRTARPTIIYEPPPNTYHSSGLWAPELHSVNGRWHVYYAAEHPQFGNKSHRMYVLGGPSADHDPTIGPWEFLGRVRGMPEEQWAIDGTVFELKGAHYLCYSGWPLGESHCDLNQELFIMKLDSPIQAAGQPIQISTPFQAWERTQDKNGDHGINEGPQWLSSPSGAWRGIIYSCSGSWTCEYKMAVLQFQGGDPLNPTSWRKDTRPLLRSRRSGQGPYGPGHGNFVNLGDDVLAVFHATDKLSDGWHHRRARCQQLIFNQHGPFMGHYVGTEVGFESFLPGQTLSEDTP